MLRYIGAYNHHNGAGNFESMWLFTACMTRPDWLPRVTVAILYRESEKAARNAIFGFDGAPERRSGAFRLTFTTAFESGLVTAVVLYSVANDK